MSSFFIWQGENSQIRIHVVENTTNIHFFSCFVLFENKKLYLSYYRLFVAEISHLSKGQGRGGGGITVANPKETRENKAMFFYIKNTSLLVSILAKSRLDILYFGV